MRLLAAFLVRDWRIRRSYPLSFLAGFGHVLFSVIVFFFVGKLVSSGHPSSLVQYGGEYFPFVLLGLSFSRYATSGLSAFSAGLREEQLQGTLEAMLASPIRPSMVLLGAIAWEMFWATVEVFLYLGIGYFAFRVDFSRADILSGLMIMLLSMVALSSLGVLSASAVLLFKEFDPVSWVLGGVMKLASGVYFPVTLLPVFLEKVADLLPLTYALEGIRKSLLLGENLWQLRGECLALVLFSLVLWPVAIFVFSATLRHLKKTGSISFR